MITRKVIVADPQDNWTKEFRLEQKVLRKLLADIVKDIHHIGSTSVPALAAKPVIDILLEVSSIPALDVQSAKLINLGYVAKGETALKAAVTLRKAEITAPTTSTRSNQEIRTFTNIWSFEIT